MYNSRSNKSNLSQFALIEKYSSKKIELSDPWICTEQDLSEQLQVELNGKHFLKGKLIKTNTRRQDNYDVLFEFEIENGKLKL